MIYTVTLNLSLDYAIKVDNFKVGKINKIIEDHMKPGGKGVNVAIVLNNFGLNAIALGFKAGFTGDEIEKRLIEMHVKTDFISIPGCNRINIKLKSNEETELNGKGPNITNESINLLKEKIKNIESGSFLVLSGSVPPSVSKSIYADLMKEITNKDIKVVVDATGEALLETLQYHPFLIKPNKDELSEIFKCEIKKKEDIEKYAKELQIKGAKNIIISIDKEGAFMLNEKGENLFINAPIGTVVDSVGAGDSLIAGFISGLIENNKYDYALLKGIATGSATAFKYGLADKKEVEELIKKMNSKN